MSAERGAVVVSLSAPELNWLAVELEQRGRLQCYVRPYMNKQRRSERLVEALPGVGGLYRSTLGRRTPPVGMPLHKVIEAGIVEDFFSAALGRWAGPGRRWCRQRVSALNFAREKAVAREAGRRAASSELVIASYGTAQYAFETVKRAGGRAVLSYPIAHNDYQRRIYAEEAARAPEFAAALPRLEQLPAEYSERLQRECALADRILVGSSFVRDSFVALGYSAAKLDLVPYGVDTALFEPRRAPRRDGPFRVLFVGQIGQRKGMSYLLQAYERFRRPDTELLLVGNYMPGADVYARYAHLYRHTPNVPQRRLLALFQEADVFVLPSLIEGMPLVVLEAMACGLPVITTAHGPADVLRDGIDGFIVPSSDAEAIRERLEQLYADAPLRRELGMRARQQALRFTWEAYGRRAADAVLQGALRSRAA